MIRVNAPPHHYHRCPRCKEDLGPCMCGNTLIEAHLCMKCAYKDDQKDEE